MASLAVKRRRPSARFAHSDEVIMAWSTPTLTEIAIGLEINGYLPPEF